MRNLGELWEDCQKGIVPNGEWEYEHLLIIDKLEYHNDSILAIDFNRELIYESFGLGNCIASQLNATLIQRPDYDIYRGSKVVLKTRIVTLEDGNTDWIDFGTFYVSKNTREDDKARIECFDVLKDSDIPFFDGTEQDILWPLPCTEVMPQVCKRLNIELDSRTSINNSYFVDDPGKMTIRQVLSYIGIMNCGNWYITEENKLRLVIVQNDIPLAEIDESMTKKIMTLGTSSFDGVQITYGKGDEDIINVGGKNSVLRLFMPWATKSIATDIYNTIKGYKYNAFEVQSVEIDPAIELGDQISINGCRLMYLV